MKARSTSLNPIATPGVRYCASPALSAVVQHLQTKTIRPKMLQYCPDGIIGEGVFGICRKAYLQRTLVCVKELKNGSHHSKSAILHEAQMLSKLCHPFLGWLIAIQIQSVPFQLVTPFYGVDDISITYHDILFKRDCPRLSSVLHYFSSCKDWTELLQDITEGLKHIHDLGLVYRDLKEDNIVRYKVGLMRVHAVLIDFGKCLPERSCTLYSLSHSERETYHKRHRHISPEVVDGAAKPSTASDIYYTAWVE